MRYPCMFLVALLTMGFGEAAFAQHGPPASGQASAPMNPGGQTGGSMSQSDIQGLADFVDNTKRLEHKNIVSKALATQRATTILNALHISCQLTDAQHRGSGKTVVGGQAVDVGLYEVACGNGMGYLLTLVGLSSASGISCFAAAATERVAGGRASGESARHDSEPVDSVCRLPANQDLSVMATTVLRSLGTACTARGVRWLGQSGTPTLDYTEVACDDGRGWVLRTPAPGAVAGIDALSCADAVTHGARCQMLVSGADVAASGASAGVPGAASVSAAAGPGSPPVAGGAPGVAPAVAATSAAAGGSPLPEGQRPDLQWFKNALSERGVVCEVKKARIVGRESVKRRYVVEYQCDRQPQGLVAYVPAPGDTVNSFESMDCAAAAERKIACQFVGGP